MLHNQSRKNHISK